MLDCLLQINLLGQLAFVAGNEYTIVQVFATMVLLGTGTATGGGYLMSYAEVRPTHLQLSSNRCTDACSLLTGCTLPAAISAAGLSAGQPRCAQLLPNGCGGPHRASRGSVAVSG